MNSKLVIIRLLQKLFKKMSRQNKSFDIYKNEFLQKLSISPSEKVTHQLIKECIEQLDKYEEPLEEVFSEGVTRIQAFLTALA